MKTNIVIFALLLSLSISITIKLHNNIENNNNNYINEITSTLKSLLSYEEIISKPITHYLSLTASSNEIEQLVNTTNRQGILFGNILHSNPDKTSPKLILDSLINYIASLPSIRAIFSSNSDTITKSLSLLSNPSSMSLLSFKQIESVADSTPPGPYTSSSIPCTPSSCPTKKLKWMKCTIVSVSLRTAYEFINMIVNILAKIAWGTCGCVEIPAGKTKKTQCSLTRSIPGVPCNVMHNALKGIFKISLLIWKGYTMSNTICLNPINPF